MSVIWSGVTEEGAVVPVQVTAEGKVVAVGDGPVGDYLPITGGELTGDLEIDGSILLNADGSATFAGEIVSNIAYTGGSNNYGSKLLPEGMFQACSATDIWRGYDQGNPVTTSSISATGSATFAGDVQVGKNPNETNTPSGAILRQRGEIALSRPTTNSIFVGYQTGNSSFTSIIRADGAASFDGDVVIGSKGSKWLIRESNGVAMLIEQTRRGQIEPRTPVKVRDLPTELDLIEAALNEVMAKLKMTPPAGWPVWDGQSEVATDNDNA